MTHSDRESIRRTGGRAATLLALMSALAIAPAVARAQRTAATGVEVTGTSASATVTWQPVKGAVSYSVKRWKQDDPKCCNNAVSDLTTTTWTDIGPEKQGFPQPGIYVFEVTAQLEGTSSVATTTWTLPPVATPTGAPAVATPVTVAPAPATLAAPPSAITKAGVPVMRAPTPMSGAIAAKLASPPAPTGVSVTGTPATATVVWKPVAGVASYVVARKQANAPVQQVKLAATDVRWYDTGVRPATAYTYMVDAIYPDGREAYTEVPFTTPPAVNPSGLTATQTGNGQVHLAWSAVPGASYYLVLGPGSSNGGVKVNGDTSYTVTSAPIGLQKWLVGTIYDSGPGAVQGSAVSTPATEFPSAQLTVEMLLSGWADLHTHPMVNLAFGGKLVQGGVDVGSLLPADASCNKGVRATTMAQALGDDRPTHGGWNALNFQCGDEIRKLLHEKFQEGNNALVTPGAATGYPDFIQWPKWNDITHQKMWFEWVKRARDGGLRVMVALATNNTTLADATSGPGDGPTDDKASADLQLAEIKSFVGRHADFMEIALGAADIKRIVQLNKIAVVLGVEIDNIGNFNKLPPTLLSSPAGGPIISGEIQRLYNLGVRYVLPIHVMDNAFGGTAIYKDDFNTANLREAGHYWDIECANVQDNITYSYKDGYDPLRAAVAYVKIGLDPLRRSGPGPVCPKPGEVGKSGGHRNARGLTLQGIFAIKEMMKRGMIVDIDHMSQQSADATLEIAESFGYPIVSGHTGIRGLAGSDAENSRTPLQLEKISKLHGMFGLGSDGVHSSQWARLYQTAMKDMGYLNPDPTKATYESGAVSFGTDLNGLVKGPMPGGGNRVVYGPSFQKSSSGSKSWDYNTDGVAHYGMMADFVKDVHTNTSLGNSFTGADLVDNHLLRNANYFWHMWERIEAKKVNVQ